MARGVGLFSDEKGEQSHASNSPSPPGSPAIVHSDSTGTGARRRPSVGGQRRYSEYRDEDRDVVAGLQAATAADPLGGLFSLDEHAGGRAARSRPTRAATWTCISVDENVARKETLLDKNAVRRITGVPPRDLRVMDPSLAYPSCLMVRERALVVNLEHVKAIITADYMLLQMPPDPDAQANGSGAAETQRAVVAFLANAERRLTARGGGGGDEPPRASEGEKPQPLPPAKAAAATVGSAIGATSLRGLWGAAGSSGGAGDAREGRSQHLNVHESGVVSARSSLRGSASLIALSSYDVPATVESQPRAVTIPVAATGVRSTRVAGAADVAGVAAAGLTAGRASIMRNRSTGSLPLLQQQSLASLTVRVPGETSASRLSSLLRGGGGGGGDGGALGGGDDELAFELRALECCLQEVVDRLCADVDALVLAATPVFDRLVSGVNKTLLERARRLKTLVARLENKVENIRDELEKLLDSEAELLDMCLTHKRAVAEDLCAQQAEERAQERAALNGRANSFSEFEFSPRRASVGGGGEARAAAAHSGWRGGSAHKSPRLAPVDGSTSLGSIGPRDATRLAAERESEEREAVEDLENMIEAYFEQIDGSSKKLAELREYINNSEDYVAIELDSHRNELIQLELLLTIATLCVSVYAVIGSLFGMNVPIGPGSLEYNNFEDGTAFQTIVIAGFAGCLALFFVIVLYCRRLRLLCH